MRWVFAGGNWVIHRVFYWISRKFVNSYYALTGLAGLVCYLNPGFHPGLWDNVPLGLLKDLPLSRAFKPRTNVSTYLFDTCLRFLRFCDISLLRPYRAY